MNDLAGGKKATKNSINKVLNSFDLGGVENKIYFTEVIQLAFEEQMISSDKDGKSNHFYKLSIATEEINKDLYGDLFNKPKKQEKIKLGKNAIKKPKSDITPKKEEPLSLKEIKQELETKKIEKIAVLKEKQEIIQEEIKNEELFSAQEFVEENNSQDVEENNDTKPLTEKEQRKEKRKKRFKKLLVAASLFATSALIVTVGIFGMNNNKKAIAKKAKDLKEIQASARKHNIVIENIAEIPKEDKTIVYSPKASPSQVNANQVVITKEYLNLLESSHDKAMISLDSTENNNKTKASTFTSKPGELAIIDKWVLSELETEYNKMHDNKVSYKSDSVLVQASYVTKLKNDLDEKRSTLYNVSPIAFEKVDGTIWIPKWLLAELENAQKTKSITFTEATGNVDKLKAQITTQNNGNTK